MGEGDIFDDTYMDTLKRGLLWFIKQGEFKKDGTMTVHIEVDGKVKKYKIKEVKM